MNSEEKNKAEEVGLPKCKLVNFYLLLATLANFIKEILTEQNMKSEKSIYDLLDKITTKYVNHVSNIASEICTEKGKKTLNVDHVIQALKKMNFDNHIKKLTSELDLSALQNEDKKEMIEDAQEMKDLINQQKKKSRKRKRQIEFTEEMANEQMTLFAKAKMDNLQSLMSQNSQELHTDNNGLKLNGNKKMRIDEAEIFVSQNKNEEEDFD